MILDCTLTCSEGGEQWEDEARRWEAWLKGKMYGFVGEELQKEGGWAVTDDGERQSADLKDWLVDELSESE